MDITRIGRTNTLIAFSYGLSLLWEPVFCQIIHLRGEGKALRYPNFAGKMPKLVEDLS